MAFRRVREAACLVLLLCALSIPARAVDLQLQQVATGFSLPLFITHAHDGSGRIFVLQQGGLIRIITSGGTVLPQPFLNIGATGLDLIVAGGEQGSLGLAFHPNYPADPRFFVNFTAKGTGNTVVEQFRVSANPDLADTTTHTLVLGPIFQPQANHNGGWIGFGPDGYLYIASGDGGGGGDNDAGHDALLGNGQSLNTLLGKILRIDVDNVPPGEGYSIPPDNPFLNDGDPLTLPEIYAYGLRNPWRNSFDRVTGRLFTGDVGQGLIEEVDIIVNGGNYGWRLKEGLQCFNPATNCEIPGLIDPITQYTHFTPAIGESVTGGYVYRGPDYPNMQGLYIFGDFDSGRIFSLAEGPVGVFTRTELSNEAFNVSSFGEDEDGELYLCDYGGGRILKVTDTSPPALGIRDGRIFE